MWQQLKNFATNGNRIGLSVEEARLAAASVQCPDQGRPQVAAVSLDGKVDATALARLLASDIGGDVQKLPVTSALPADSYQLLLVEVPDVPVDEVASAIPWKIKDLLDSPVEDTVIELFEMPDHTVGGAQRMAYAVAARRAVIDQHVGLLRGARVSLDVISIPELCLSNIATRLPQDRDGVALLHLAEDHGVLTISRGGVLYLIRRIERGKRSLRDAGDDHALSEAQSSFLLEVQRSLDYYESHFDHRPLSEIVLAPGSDISGLSSVLGEQLGIAVSNLDLNQIFDMQGATSPEEQGACLLAIGAGLRTAEATA